MYSFYLPGCVTYEAVFDFPGELDTHLTLRQGDVVHVHRKEDNGWWRGTVADKTGWFPSNYVQAVLHGRLSHLGLDCVGEGGGNRRRGVDLDVHRMEDNGWWRGTVADKTGWFPSNNVQAALHGRYLQWKLEDTVLEDTVLEGRG